MPKNINELVLNQSGNQSGNQYIPCKLLLLAAAFVISIASINIIYPRLCDIENKDKVLDTHYFNVTSCITVINEGNYMAFTICINNDNGKNYTMDTGIISGNSTLVEMSCVSQYYGDNKIGYCNDSKSKCSWFIQSNTCLGTSISVIILSLALPATLLYLIYFCFKNNRSTNVLDEPLI